MITLSALVKLYISIGCVSLSNEPRMDSLVYYTEAQKLRKRADEMEQCDDLLTRIRGKIAAMDEDAREVKAKESK